MTPKEAIERIKTRFDKWALDDKDFDAIRTLIPELAESEDERMRKTLLEYFNERNSYRDEDETFYGVPFPSIIAYLEKQKEQKHYWKPTETDVALFNKAIITNKALTPVERARLDTIRSKFSYCRAVNCSGIMQKEQKPDIEFIQRSWYMEGYHDRKFGNEPKWIIKTGEGGPEYELNPKYGQPLAEEQKPAEWSEDDKLLIDAAIYWLERRLATERARDISTRDCPLSMKKTVERFKSLRLQLHRNPSEKLVDEDEEDYEQKGRRNSH